MWIFWVYVLLGAWEKTKSYKIFTNFWFRIFSYTFWGLILVKIWWKFTCKKNLESLFWPESKIHLIEIEVIDIAHILYELDFWFRQNSDPEIFFTEKKNSGFSAKISCSQILFCNTLTGMKDEQGSK